MSKVSIDALSQTIMKELNRYNKATSDDMKQIVKEVAQDVKKDIQSSAPKSTGKYAKSWAVKTTKQSSNSLSLIVHSRHKYQLTHLLEFGHAKRGGGRVSARPHIAQAEEQGNKALEEKIKERLGNG
ncbi:HK97 gp10 family phage protein [Aerococcaceae bacterium NML191219]|nr:HK97 gp10 family phage protein [Aerococcaceae bacterium NML191219]